MTRLDANWRKSTYSDHGACVEVRHYLGAVQVRDTKDRSGGTLAFSTGTWAAFTAALRVDGLAPREIEPA